MTEPRQIALVRSYPELMDALATRVAELRWTHQTVDEISGLQSGYASKLLAPKPIKHLGPMSFDAMLGALGLAVVVIVDPEARIMNHAAERERPGMDAGSVPASRRYSREAREIVRDLMRKMQRKGASKISAGMRKRLSHGERKRRARHAAKARWRREDRKNRQPRRMA